MTAKTFELMDTYKYERPKKIPWYWAPIFCGLCYLLFYAAVIPSYYAYPKTLLMREEHKHRDEFIGERAQTQLFGLAKIGPKLTGSYENEVLAVDYLLNEIKKIQTTARNDLYDIEVDVQHASGQFMIWNMATTYRNLTNVVVKLAPKNTQSKSYLLVNSHFDTEVGSPGAADAGVMIVVMLETLRVISQSEKILKNPIVFLMNGAEESNMLAAHGFITQHKWAQFCKALINLDSAGAGGREVLFQTAPDHPWLMKYYKSSVLHPSASTIAEELFQHDMIPSDSDYGVFRDYGGLPGLDMAHTLNGYIYHTKYDTFKNVERGTYQTTGENILALTWALANAPELEDPKAHEGDQTVYYDYLGWFMISYSETTGIVINILTSVGAFIVIGISVYLMTKKKDVDTPKTVYMRFLFIFLIQVLAIVAPCGKTIFFGWIVKLIGRSQLWYSSNWLLFGIYFCPTFALYGIIQASYIARTKKKTSMALNDTISCFLHAHCIILALACIIMTAMGIRSAFFLMVGVFFYTISVIINILTRQFIKRDYFLPIHLVCQLFPYWFYTYLTYQHFKVFIPMLGRSGPTTFTELHITVFVGLSTLLFGGFLLPIIHKCHKPKTLFSTFSKLTLLFIVVSAATTAGDPYRSERSPQRFYVLHTTRIIHDFKGLAANESGYYIQPVDAHPSSLDKTTFEAAVPKSWVKEACDTQVFCGLPLYSTRWKDWKDSARWIPAAPPNVPVPTELTLISKETLAPTRIRLDFTLKSADRVVMYITPQENVKVIDWSFDRTLLDEQQKPPYFTYHVHSMDDTALQFWIEVEREPTTTEGPLISLGVGAHFLYHTHTYTTAYQEFLESFPDWVYPTHWAASFESWIF